MQAVVGGVVKSYQFTCEENQEIAQGSMRIMFNKDDFCECGVTVVILKDSEANDGITGETIVHNTRKLSDSVNQFWRLISVLTAAVSINGLWFMRNLKAISTVQVRLQFQSFVKWLMCQS